MGVKISATDAALLGLLTRGELSGYDLQRAADANGGLFWAPAKSRINAELPPKQPRSSHSIESQPGCV